ncbi:unnamed protein product [Penicillium olsonii]|nr:unnamed protein product [Penicillium olsonii]
MKLSHHRNIKPFPTLAPCPPRVLAPQTSPAVTKPKKNSTACLACKAAKRKCSGPDAPCKACRAANTECYFDPSRDLRRKVAVKRTIIELTNHKELLATLIETLKKADEPELEQLLNLIRGEATLEAIAEEVGAPVMRFADPQELSTSSQLAISEYGDQPVEVSGSGSQPRRTSDVSNVASSPDDIQFMTLPPMPVISPYARISLESLCDIPLFEVPARPWTDVTDSDYLVSHLVSLYFTWDHPGSQFLDQRVFLAHMKKADLDSGFCTPLLVNSLLATASTYSDSLDVFSIPDNAYSRGQSFFDEAQKLWETEAEASLSSSSLPNVQALLMMSSLFKLRGRISKSWLVLGQAVRLAQGMGLFDSPSSAQETALTEMERVRTITAWSIFNLSSQLSIELKIIAPLPCPVLGIRLCGIEDVNWTPYPRSNKITYDKKLARLPDIRQGQADIAKISSDIQGLLSQRNQGISADALWKEANAYFDRLSTCLQLWPSLEEMGADPVPQLYLLRIKCLETIITLFEMFNDPAHPQFAQEAQDHQTRSAHEMAQCLRLHRRSYGTKHVPSQMVSATQAALRVMICHFDISDESMQAFAELSLFGTTFGYKYKETASAMREIRTKVTQENIRLPDDIITILGGPGDKGYDS